MNVRGKLGVFILLLIVAGIFCVGITWGLPSHRVDPFLFGEHPVWTGAEIVRLAGDRADEKLGADVDANPIVRGASPIELNATDQQRAEIVRRYRLFTDQPDEMITMMALGGMKTSATSGRRDFDPKLYQYGGLWIYPVGLGIKLFARPNPSGVIYYLDHPEEFAKFYLIARAYVVEWAVIGALAIYWMGRRAGADRFVASCAVLCYALLSVVVNMAHEAKPHLPGAVLILLAVICATKYVETGLKKWWVLAGVCCGAACAMVLSAIPCLIILPIMVMLRRESGRESERESERELRRESRSESECEAQRESWNQRVVVLISSLIIAVDVYFMCNPYVLIHLLGDRTVLMSNLRNSQAMYRTPISLGGIWNAIKLVGTGVTPWMMIAACCVMAKSGLRLSALGEKCSAMVVLLASVCGLVLLQFAFFATGKPAEYARFALLPDIALMLLAVIGMAKLAHPRIAPIALVLIVGLYGVSYDWHFVRDAIARPTRIIAAERLRDLNRGGATTLGIIAEPAPYDLPPVDLFKWKILLLPKDETGAGDADVMIRTVDASAADSWIRPRLFPTPISWASKPFEVKVRQKQAR